MEEDEAEVKEKERPSRQGKAAATSTAAEKNHRHHSPMVVADRPLVGTDMDQTAVELNQQENACPSRPPSPPEPSGVHSRAAPFAQVSTYVLQASNRKRLSSR
mmetsp:Transcript_31037/g.103367  ORF Transcript_31037/g.103367 Transcript_31037/m.103367 type:complete len:103 (-) Transcript_31037:552-860(-)